MYVGPLSRSSRPGSQIPSEKPHFFLPKPLVPARRTETPKREFDMLPDEDRQAFDDFDFRARWWPGEDIGNS